MATILNQIFTSLVRRRVRIVVLGYLLVILLFKLFGWGDLTPDTERRNHQNAGQCRE